MNAPLFLCLSVACWFMAFVIFASACQPLKPRFKYEHVRFWILSVIASVFVLLGALILILIIVNLFAS